MWSRFVMSQVKHNSYFLCGVALGLWVSLALIPLDEEAGCAGVPPPAARGVPSPAAPDEYAPAREERPLGPAGQAAGRSVQRPRYYTTELGMRGSLLSGVLSSEDALKSQVAALNQTMARLQPALKFFITASAMSAVPGLANVVGFTDTREMLKPFHALKYLADNYLEEYDFFFLVSDGAFVNARRLTELVSKLSVSQDVYMGTVAEDDSHYCSLESGFIISNGVLRAVHAELDWCVRNSYSPHHHENLGRCILHAAHLSCAAKQQGQSYLSVHLSDTDDDELTLSPTLADAVTSYPAPPHRIHRLHAYVARVQLERARAAVVQLRAALWSVSARHPPAARNATWPGGLRSDPGLAAPTPDSRFDHQRWTLFNASHAFMPDELRAAAPLAAPTAEAIQLVVSSVRAWALRRWSWASGAELAEGAWQWDAPRAMRYRLLLRLSAPTAEVLRQVEVARALGSARLVPVRYVTESARLWLVLPLPCTSANAAAALAFLRRYKLLHAPRDANTNLFIVSFPTAECNASRELAPLRAALATSPGAASLVEAGAAPGDAGEGDAGRAALRALRDKLPGDALVLLLLPDLEFNHDFLNRVRMNTIQGVSWFSPLPFRRHALHALQAAHAGHAAPRSQTGRFNQHCSDVVAFYKSDFDAAEAAWRGRGRGDGDGDGGVARVLGGGALRGVRAPEPGAALPPRRAAPAPRPALATLQLGARAALAQLLLEAQHRPTDLQAY